MPNWWTKGRQTWKRYLPSARNLSKALRPRHINLFFALVFSLAGAVVIAIVAAWVLAPRLNVGTQETSPADLTRIALTIAAGVGGVVALVVAYRRQRDLEQGRFVERFGAAAQQLGDADVAVRMAGVYAMAGAADQTSKLKRQQCIDVLCGYLRLPYSPELGNNHQSGRTLKKPVLRVGGLEEELRFQYRQNDKEVRQTIVRVISSHLQKKAGRSWSSNDFDFTGSHLEEPDFSGATFSGATTLFTGVTFSGGTTSFLGATFSSAQASFDETTFSAGYTSFDEATFSGRNTSFGKAIFSGENTNFSKAIFSGENTNFSKAIFSGENTTFSKATFSGENTFFIGATFSNGYTTLKGVTFNGRYTTFSGATFSGKYISFTEATFSGGYTSFDETTFSGGYTSFLGADFGSGKVIFENPRAWNPAPAFDWNIEIASKPANVEPQDWPPPLKTPD